MNDLFRIDGQVAVVTGALGNLGPVWIETLLEGGATVLALDLAQAEISPDYRNLHERFDESRLELDRADVRDRESLEAACERCLKRFGVPAVLVNNAGIDQPPDKTGTGWLLEDIPFEINRDIFEVNTLGLFWPPRYSAGIWSGRRMAPLSILDPCTPAWPRTAAFMITSRAIRRF